MLSFLGLAHILCLPVQPSTLTPAQQIDNECPWLPQHCSRTRHILVNHGDKTWLPFPMRKTMMECGMGGGRKEDGPAGWTSAGKASANTPTLWVGSRSCTSLPKGSKFEGSEPVEGWEKEESWKPVKVFFWVEWEVLGLLNFGVLHIGVMSKCAFFKSPIKDQ